MDKNPIRVHWSLVLLDCKTCKFECKFKPNHQPYDDFPVAYDAFHVLTEPLNDLIWTNKLFASAWQIIASGLLDIVCFGTFGIWIFEGNSF